MWLEIYFEKDDGLECAGYRGHPDSLRVFDDKRIAALRVGAAVCRARRTGSDPDISRL